MSHVDTSIGFSLRSEPPSLTVPIGGVPVDFESYSKAWMKEYMPGIATFMVVIAFANKIVDPLFKGWKGWQSFGQDLLGAAIVAVVTCGVFYISCRLARQRQARRTRTAGFDSPIVHLTAEGQWVTFRFASGREFVDRWDRLLRFKSAPEFTEFEFPANPPIIIPTMALPVETIRTISQFCAAEKIPSETKR